MKKLAILLMAGLVSFSSFNDGVYASVTNSTNIIDDNSIVTNATQVQDTMALGKLYFVNIKEGEKPIMNALRLYGDRCGSESFNNKPYATEGIRSIFELNEWIDFYPQASATSGIKVMVFTHKADQSFYIKNSLNDKTPGYIQELNLNKDPEQEENYHWGSFYLNPEEVSPGYYDFVFIYKNKVFATMLTHLYKEEEISDKSDSELEELMSQSLK